MDRYIGGYLSIRLSDPLYIYPPSILPSSLLILFSSLLPAVNSVEVLCSEDENKRVN